MRLTPIGSSHPSGASFHLLAGRFFCPVSQTLCSSTIVALRQVTYGGRIVGPCLGIESPLSAAPHRG